MMRISFYCSVVFAIGCESSSPATPDGSTDAPDPDAAAMYVAFQVPDQGGPVIETPAIVTVTWPSDPLAADLHSFDDWFTHSAAWIATLAEYRVKAGLTATAWTAPSPAPATIDDVDIQALLRDAIENGTLPHNASTLYTIYPPDGTVVTQTFQSMVYRSCIDFAGYHGSATLTDGTYVYYALAPRCPPQEGLSQLDSVTWAASHEIAEASTDPDPDSPAWRLPYAPSTFYLAPYGGEIGDLCLGYPLPIENHVITALYSNTAAAAGQRWCVPAPAGPQFVADPEPHDLAITAGGGADTTVAIMSPTSVTSLSLAMAAFGPGITLTPSSSTVSGGDHVAVHVNVSASTPAGVYVVGMKLSGPDYKTITYAIVTVS